MGTELFPSKLNIYSSIKIHFDSSCASVYPCIEEYSNIFFFFSPWFTTHWFIQLNNLKLQININKLICRYVRFALFIWMCKHTETLRARARSSAAVVMFPKSFRCKLTHTHSHNKQIYFAKRNFRIYLFVFFFCCFFLSVQCWFQSCEPIHFLLNSLFFPAAVGSVRFINSSLCLCCLHECNAKKVAQTQFGRVQHNWRNIKRFSSAKFYGTYNK